MTGAGKEAMQRVLICAAHGGFGVSRKAFLRLRELGSTHALAEPDYGEMWDDGSGPRKPFASLESFLGREIPRDDPLLLQVYDEMGDDASASLRKLKLIEVPVGVSWHIEEYDGLEWVAEDHRTWQ